MSRAAGFTLLEVVVATGILAVGILSLVGLQAQSLQVQQRLRVQREMVALAEAELDWRLASGRIGVGECRSAAARRSPITACTVEGRRCSGDEPCGGTNTGRAVRVRVAVEAVGDQSFEIEALGARFGGP